MVSPTTIVGPTIRSSTTSLKAKAAGTIAVACARNRAGCAKSDRGCAVLRNGIILDSRRRRSLRLESWR